VIGDTCIVRFEMWAGRSKDGVVGYVLIPADHNQRQEMRRANPDSMRERVTTFAADNWEEARTIYEERYEAIALEWEARYPKSG
jgi:hypothetical protein